MLMTLMHLRIAVWYKPEHSLYISVRQFCMTILTGQKVWRPYLRHIEKVMKADITCGILIKEAYKKL